ncbi:hypothetical protein [Microbacterium testaceum]|uniref:hypothetical protein n=1 Tax=Microbacterium testaceum TaxID=2033 RepID=UPI000943C55C|nr:hypothetical protein [Microbacterium testaceum]
MLRVLARYIDADHEFPEALTIATDAGEKVNIAIVRSNRALLWIAIGRIPDTERELTAIIDAAGHRALSSALASLALAAEARRGAFAQAARRWDRVAAADVDYAASADVRLLRARIDARAGRFKAAIGKR